MQCSDLSTALVCYTDIAGVKQTLVAHYEYRKNASGATVLHATRYSTSDGTPLIPNLALGSMTVGQCNISSVRRVFPLGCNIASGTEVAKYVGFTVGTTWAPLAVASRKLQSFTVTATKGQEPSTGNYIEVLFSGNKICLLEGESFTWSVSQDSSDRYEELLGAFSVNAFGNSSAGIASTEHEV